MHLPNDLDTLLENLLLYQSVSIWEETRRLVRLFRNEWVVRFEKQCCNYVVLGYLRDDLNDWLVDELLESPTLGDAAKDKLLRYCLKERVFRTALSLRDNKEKLFRLLLLIHQTNVNCYWYRKRIHSLNQSLQYVLDKARC